MVCIPFLKKGADNMEDSGSFTENNSQTNLKSTILPTSGFCEGSQDGSQLPNVPVLMNGDARPSEILGLGTTNGWLREDIMETPEKLHGELAGPSGSGGGETKVQAVIGDNGGGAGSPEMVTLMDTIKVLSNQVQGLSLTTQHLSAEFTHLQGTVSRMNGEERNEGSSPPPHPNQQSGGIGVSPQTAMTATIIKLPDYLLKAARSNQFVQLEDFLPHNFQNFNDHNANFVDAVFDDGKVQFKHSKPRKRIDNFSVWLTAWNIYENAIITAEPFRYNELCTYRQQVHDCNKKYRWQSVYAYDVKFRYKMSITPDMRFDKVDPDLYVTSFDTTAVRHDAHQCLRCRSYDHVTVDCPFPDNNDVGADGVNRRMDFHKLCCILKNTKVGPADQ